MLREILIYISAFIGLFAVIFYTLGLLSKRKEKLSPLTEDRLPSVSVVIPAYNEEKGIAATIKSALNLDYPRDKFKVIVVDDYSKDRTHEIARKFQSKNVEVYTKKHGGKGAALNYGIRKAKSEIIVTMDADTIAEKNALKNMVYYFSRKEVMCVTPVMAIHKPRRILERIQQVEYFLGVFLRKAFASMNAIHITPGAFSAYRKSFFDKYGGYDEKNITEDLEIALRIQYHHFVIENSMKSIIYTVPPDDFRALLRQRKRWYNGLMTNLWNYRRLFSKEYGDLGTIVLPVAVITIVLSVILTLWIGVRMLIEIQKDLALFRSVNFDFSGAFQINKYVFDRFIFNVFSNPIFLMAFFSMFILVGYMIFAKSKVKKNAEIKLSFILFLFLYTFLFSFWWIISFFETLFRRKVSWGKKEQSIKIR